MHNLIIRFVLGVFCAFIVVTMLWTGVIYWRSNVAADGTEGTNGEKLFFSMMEQALVHIERRGGDEVDDMPARLERLFGQKVAVIPMDSPRILDAHRHLLAQGVSAVRLERSFGGPTKTYFVPLRGNDRVLAIGPLAPRQLLTGWQTAGFILSVILVVSATGAFIAIPPLAMMQAMERTSHKIIAGDIGARIPVDTTGWRFLPPDIRKVLLCFNRLAEHNQQLFQKQQHLLQAVAHELRTPTVRMRFELEMLALAQTEQQREDRLEALDEDVCEIDGFIDELVAYNKLEYSDALDLLPIPVSQVFEKETAGLSHIVGARRIRLEGGEGVKVKADERLFARALKNLIANAIRHCNKDVVVRCEVEGGVVKIHVDDDGPGVPEESRNMIFEPFARLDGSRNKKSGGLGLGLAIVRRIADLHGAHVEIGQAPEPLNGARFSLVWDCADEARKSRAPQPAASSVPTSPASSPTSPEDASESGSSSDAGDGRRPSEGNPDPKA